MSKELDLAGAVWVWPDAGRSTPNQYVEFRHVFNWRGMPAAGSDAAILTISVDTNHAVWLNGHFLDCGQFPDYPENKTCDILPVKAFLQQGNNTLAILAYHQGRDSSTYRQGPPGLMYALRAPGLRIDSGSESRCRPSPAYREGEAPMITRQIGFTFEYDARNDDGWRNPDYQAGAEWRAPTEVAERRATRIRPRPLPKLTLFSTASARVTAQGVFYRTADRDLPAADLIQTDALSFRRAADLGWPHSEPRLPSADGLCLDPSRLDGAHGFYLILDIGGEESGLLDLDLDAAPGTVVDMAYGQHLDDGRVRAAVGGRHFAHRHICNAGRRQFTHYMVRAAGRYLQFHFHGLTAPCVIYSAGMRPYAYPDKVQGAWESSDRLLNRIDAVSRRTLTLCRHDHFEDTPWREQALYANDGRNQAITGYYCFGDTNFTRESLALLGAGLRPDGWLEMCAPARCRTTIPSFTLAWILAVRDYWLHTGDREGTKALTTTVRQVLAAAGSHLRNGLLPCPTGPNYWHFYDWAAGLNGSSQAPKSDWGATMIAEHLFRFDAPLNALFVMALDAAAELVRAENDETAALQFEQTAQLVGSAARPAFWDATEGAFRTSLGACPELPPFAELTQSLALIAGLAEPDQTDALRRRLASENNGLVPVTLSQSFYKYEALLADRPTHGAWVFERLMDTWSAMLFQGATTFWETGRGADDFNQAGSLCHGWSAIPVYFIFARFLGIRPLKPGFRLFSLDPWFPAPIQIRAKIPTPHGMIELQLAVNADGADGSLECPSGVKSMPAAQVRLSHAKS